MNYSQKLKQKFCRSNSESEFIALNISLSVWSFSRCMCIRKMVLRLILSSCMSQLIHSSVSLCLSGVICSAGEGSLHRSLLHAA